MDYSIGNVHLENPVILAPMAGVTDMPFRRLVKSWGVDLVVSEMIASKAMVRAARKTLRMSASGADEFPVAVQLAGNEPEVMAEAARLNRQGVDLNWAFDRPELSEIDIVRRFIDGRRFQAVIDLHEDWESRGFYLYELRRDGAHIGHDIVRRVEPVCPINADPIIEGDPAHAGVIHPDLDNTRRRRRGDAIPINLYRRHTNHLVTAETPTTLPMSERVAAHLMAVSSMIAAHSGG